MHACMGISHIRTVSIVKHTRAYSCGKHLKRCLLEVGFRSLFWNFLSLEMPGINSVPVSTPYCCPLRDQTIGLCWMVQMNGSLWRRQSFWGIPFPPALRTTLVFTGETLKGALNRHGFPMGWVGLVDCTTHTLLSASLRESRLLSGTGEI